MVNFFSFPIEEIPIFDALILSVVNDDILVRVSSHRTGRS